MGDNTMPIGMPAMQEMLHNVKGAVRDPHIEALDGKKSA